jgi:Flp pilus assembly CpaF family ATPase
VTGSGQTTLLVAMTLDAARHRRGVISIDTKGDGHSTTTSTM